MLSPHDPKMATTVPVIISMVKASIEGRDGISFLVPCIRKINLPSTCSYFPLLYYRARRASGKMSVLPRVGHVSALNKIELLERRDMCCIFSRLLAMAATSVNSRTKLLNLFVSQFPAP